MDADTLAELVSQRHGLLRELLEMSGEQIAAIDENRLTDLMRLLSKRQQRIEQLAGVTAKLQPASQDDPAARQWPSEAARQKCRQEQQQCNQMHEQLMEIEASCQQMLQANRSQIEGRLERLSDGQRAATGYAKAAAYQGEMVSTQSSGNRLDLSSD